MEAKDYLPIAISVLGFIFSLFATGYSFRHKKYEEERAARAQLNETVGKIIGARIDHAKYLNEHPDVRDNFTTSNVLGSINYQINSFARLAVYVTERIPQLVTDIEFAAIADAFAWTGDQIKAQEYWRAAVSNSKDRHYEILNRRQFANYLFTIGDLGAGRDQYKRALELTPVKDDYSKYMTGYTYRMWAVNEAQVGNGKSASDHFELAEEAYKTISVEMMRNEAFADLDKMRKFDFKLGMEIKPGALPAGLPSA